MLAEESYSAAPGHLFFMPVQIYAVFRTAGPTDAFQTGSTIS